MVWGAGLQVVLPSVRSSVWKEKGFLKIHPQQFPGNHGSGITSLKELSKLYDFNIGFPVISREA